MRHGRRRPAVRRDAHGRHVIVDSDRRLAATVDVADPRVQRVSPDEQRARCRIVLGDGEVGALDTARLRRGYVVAVDPGEIRALRGGAAASPGDRYARAGDCLPVCVGSENNCRQNQRGEVFREREEQAAYDSKIKSRHEPPLVADAPRRGRDDSVHVPTRSAPSGVTRA